MAPPVAVRTYLRITPTASFQSLKSACALAMDSAFHQEQKGLCAFCCDRLTDRTRIAHVSPQASGQVSPTAWSNLVLSCDSQHLSDPSCDAAQGSTVLPVSPLIPGVQSLFEFRASGQMIGRNQAAQDTIRILNLDSNDRNHRLRAARRTAITVMAQQRRSLSSSQWARLLRGNYQPLPAFQPALEAVLGP